MSRRSEAREHQIKTVLDVPMIHYNPFCTVLKNRVHKAAYSALIKRGLYAPVPNRNYVYAITPAGLEYKTELLNSQPTCWGGVTMNDKTIYQQPHIPNNYNGDE